MPPPLSLESLRDLLSAALGHVPEVKLAVLFGSQARGEARARSDVDLAVALATSAPETRHAVRAALTQAVAAPLDIVFLDDAPALLRMEIARRWRVLLERSAGAWVDFRARAMIDWGDIGPFLRRQWEASSRRLRAEVSVGPA